MRKHSIESHFAIRHSASVFHSYQLQWRKTSYSKKKNSKYKKVSITMKKISYSKYKIGISYNKENKLFKVQKR